MLYKRNNLIFSTYKKKHLYKASFTSSYKYLLKKSKIDKFNNNNIKKSNLTHSNLNSFAETSLFLYKKNYHYFLNEMILSKRRKLYLNHLMNHFNFKKSSILIKKISDSSLNHND